MSTTLTVSYGAQYTDIGSRRHPSYAIAPRLRTAATRAKKVSWGEVFCGGGVEREADRTSSRRAWRTTHTLVSRIFPGQNSPRNGGRLPGFAEAVRWHPSPAGRCGGLRRFFVTSAQDFSVTAGFRDRGVFVTGVGFRDEVLTRAVENANEIARECGGDFKYIQAKMLRPRRRLNRRCIPSVHTTRIQRTYGRRRD